MKVEFNHKMKKALPGIFSDGKSFFKLAVFSFLLVTLVSCASQLQTKVSGNLNRLSGNTVVAILPVEVKDASPREAARLFRQLLHTRLKQSNFEILEHYIVDGLLKKNGLTDPQKYPGINPMHLGEVLGADAVLISRLNKVKRSYLLLHSSIELSISLQMVDTRSGEILWRAEQTESENQGVWKIPTGMASALVAPVYFVTNKLSLNRITRRMVEKLTEIVKHPGRAGEDETFEQPVIASAAARDMRALRKVQNVRAKWLRNAYPKEEDLWSRSDLAKVHGTRSRPPQPVTLAANYTPAPEASVTLLNRVNPPARFDTEPDFYALGLLPPEAEHRASAGKPAAQVKPAMTPAAALPAATVSPQTLKVYTVQVGAYKTPSLAENLVGWLVGKGYQAFLTVPAEKGKRPLYKVRVAMFPNKLEAQALARKLARKEHLDNFVTTLHPG